MLVHPFLSLKNPMYAPANLCIPELVRFRDSGRMGTYFIFLCPYLSTAGWMDAIYATRNMASGTLIWTKHSKHHNCSTRLKARENESSKDGNVLHLLVSLFVSTKMNECCLLSELWLGEDIEGNWVVQL